MTSSDFIGVRRITDEDEQKASIRTPRLPAMDESWLMQELRARQVKIVAQPPAAEWWTGVLV